MPLGTRLKEQDTERLTGVHGVSRQQQCSVSPGLCDRLPVSADTILAVGRERSSWLPEAEFGALFYRARELTSPSLFTVTGSREAQDFYSLHPSVFSFAHFSSLLPSPAAPGADTAAACYRPVQGSRPRQLHASPSRGSRACSAEGVVHARGGRAFSVEWAVHAAQRGPCMQPIGTADYLCVEGHVWQLPTSF